MVELRLEHTSALDVATRDAIRQLLDAAFGGDVDDHDYEHTLGGMHAMVWDGTELIGHGSVVLRRLLHEGRALRAGYVEGVAVRPDRQGQGNGAAVMAEVERIIRGGYEVGALGSSEIATGFYESRGWLKWMGTASAISPSGLLRTPEEEGWIYVLPVSAPLRLSGDLACDWRDGDVW
jgi:aminoglycoside 2'-N-acetyltransferase I